MIKRIAGTLGRVEFGSIEIAVGPVVHEVLVPELVRRARPIDFGLGSKRMKRHCSASIRMKRPRMLGP